MSESANPFWTYALPIIGLVIAAITAIGVFYGPKLVARSQDKKEKLRKHFNDLQKGVLEPLTEIIANINIKNGSIFTDSTGPFDHLDSEQLECFQAHYPALEDKWRELGGKWTKQQGLTGGRWTEHNEKVEAFEKQIGETIEKKCKEKGISLPIKRFRTNEELINDNLPQTFRNMLFVKSQGSDTDDNFSEANITKEGEFYVIKLRSTKWANARTLDVAEKCKAVFTLIQNSTELKQKASLIFEEAKQIEGEFEKLLSNLKKIQSRGFISRDPKYKFQAVKMCPICKEFKLV